MFDLEVQPTALSSVRKADVKQTREFILDARLQHQIWMTGLVSLPSSLTVRSEDETIQRSTLEPRTDGTTSCEER